MLHPDVTFTVDLEFTDLVLMETIKRHPRTEWVCSWYMSLAATNWPSYSHLELRFPAPCKDFVNQSLEFVSVRYELALSRTRYGYIRGWRTGVGWGGGRGEQSAARISLRPSVYNLITRCSLLVHSAPFLFLHSPLPAISLLPSREEKTRYNVHLSCCRETMVFVIWLVYPMDPSIYILQVHGLSFVSNGGLKSFQCRSGRLGVFSIFQAVGFAT